jgi:hypothetical protein
MLVPCALDLEQHNKQGIRCLSNNPSTPPLVLVSPWPDAAGIERVTSLLVAMRDAPRHGMARQVSEQLLIVL